MSKAREIPWPEEFNELKRIEELMICGICYEYIDTTVMTPCSHNYCSLCIRKYLHYKTQCPACFHNVFEKDLYINRAMDSLIEHYFNVREKLITLIENRVVYNKVVQQEPEQVQAMPVRPVRCSQPKSPQISETKKVESKLSQLCKVSEIKQIEPKSPVKNSPLASTSKCNPCTPTTMSHKIIPSIAKIFNTPKRKDPVPTQPPVNTKTVSCPVCKVDISELHVNVHLDACLKREISEKSGKAKVDAPKRPPLPKLVLRVMKDAELRKKMKELGLPTQGDRRALENRFTRYSTIYNSECDKVEPRPISELIRQCEMEEKQERKMDMFLVASTAAPTVRLQVERNAKEEKIEEAQKNYRVANKSSFDKLIEEVRNRKKMEKAKQNSDTIASTITEADESTSLNSKHDYQSASSSSKQDDPSGTISKPSTYVKVEKVSENLSENEESSIYNPSSEIAFQDSDSDESSCPLQHYRNDGQMKYSSMNLNDSSPCTSTSSSPNKRLQVIKNEHTNYTKTTKFSVPSVSNNVTNNPYEAPTDESTDDDIPRSPLLNSKSTNNKRAKLSVTTLNKSDTIEDEARQAEARDLCNSIIKDFAFDDSDDSLSEFVIKYKTDDIKKIETKKINNSLTEASSSKIVTPQKIETEKINKSLNEASSSKLATPQKKGSSFCDKKVPESNSVDDFVNDILNGDDSTELIDTSIAGSSEARKRKSREKQNSPLQSNSIKIEKENDATSANEHSPPPVTENTARRPVRKRNRPSRFTNSEVVKKGDIEKTPTKLLEDSQDSESPEHFKSSTSDGSLKRRRGRPKVNKELTLDETQNPPKRPVRRRQAASDRN
ncbi:hypothetical protein TSAR_000092 [Trichomalopsis sarcophagae]|uniref:RING-type E3 ubiquitin transferase n=1 Tax=Trichomalopsis sarcophagae TaxID=543379 RepID=A0A232EQQ0_9HYME|nr:hypothetical protein TSAR_000092 [Trichomalopsis sarcophagae]